MSEAARITIRGVVQGVGFRPYCYRLSRELGLAGYVRNLGDASVEVYVEGFGLERFIELLRSAPPPAKVEEIKVERVRPLGLSDFKILESVPEAGSFCPPPPDLATCEECLRELLNPKNRRYLYPFITCMHCGPRFTILLSLPYDRKYTTMREFPLCQFCEHEYNSPEDRRFRAEPNCCPSCGPRVRLYDGEGRALGVKNPISEAAKLLDEGRIVTIKGIGGTHLAVKASEDGPIRRLRELYRRPQQPYPVMSRDLERVREFAEVGRAEAELLLSPARPIVALRKRENFPLSGLLSPGLDTVGVMLPYSGLHHLLLSYGRELAYVLTSANLPGMPMCTRNEQVFRLEADYHLLHNRRIENRCDDSVLRLTAGKPVFLRRSRGYVPIPIPMGSAGELRILAVGAELSLTFSLLKDRQCFPSQHIGDLTKLEVLEYLRDAIAKWRRLLKVERLDAVACDLHPQLLSTGEAERIAREEGCRLIRVQHHHAHLASVMAEAGLESLIGISADGVGYGEDGTVWGGEVMLVEGGRFERLGYLSPRPMPGGDLATVFPARMVAGVLWGILSQAEIEELLVRLGTKPEEAEMIVKQLETGVNVFQTSSCGRLLDALSCVLGICDRRTYEGEPAMKLEAAARGGRIDCLTSEPWDFIRGNLIESPAILLEVLEGMKRNIGRKHLAAWAQNLIGECLALLAVEEAKRRGIEVVGGSGGVFYNDFITASAEKMVGENGLKFLTNRLLPQGDGGISAGQIYVAIHRFEL
ncbi:MAG: carbamoyltransferase HypF [Candidatus Hadarchaeales archaeon]